MGLWKFLKRGTLNMMVAVDQLINAAWGGDPDETISSRAGKLAYQKPYGPLWARCVVWLVLRLDPDHYPRTIEADEGRDAL